MGVLQSLVKILCLIIIHLSFLADGGGVGLNYGLMANNPPTPNQVLSLVKRRGVTRVRIFNPNQDILKAARGSGIQVILGTLNSNIPNLANDINFAKNWVQNNVVLYESTVIFRCICVGSEVTSGDLTSAVLPAIKNLNVALQSFNLGRIPVTTSIGISLLASSYPPSSGDFRSDIKPAMQQIASYLGSNGFPILVTAYPYFAFASNPREISISYALLNSTEVVVRDGNLGYTNMFDVMVDAVYWALEKVGGGSVEVVICETGWPSKGNGDYTTPSLAQTYNQNLVNHVVSSGTPKKPSMNVETYIFAMFNEDQKTPGVEQNWGLYYPDLTEVYHIDFR